MNKNNYSLFCIGNSLLDILVTNGEGLLKKYDLKANDSILADKKHETIYEEIANEHEVTYLAGGSENAARAAAYVLPPGSVVYTGCIGDDHLAEQLNRSNKREGLEHAYYIKEGEKTGACAVIITGHHRSLVTTLRAAEKFDIAHLSTTAVAAMIDGAKILYVDGYFLTHGLSSALELGLRASETGKIFACNLSAPYIPQNFAPALAQIIFYCDYIIGNESEAEAWSVSNGIEDFDNIPVIAKQIALLPKSNNSRPRVVVITHGAEPTVVVSSAQPNEPKFFPVEQLTDDQIIDTNGAGDAFAGGFLGGLVADRTLDECVHIGHIMGSMSIQQVGSQYKWPKMKIL